MDRHPVFFVTDWYIFEVFVGSWELGTLNMCSRLFFVPVV